MTDHSATIPTTKGTAMSTFTTTANLARLVKAITPAASTDQTVPSLGVIHMRRVGESTLRLTATDRFVVVRVDVPGEWPDVDGTDTIDDIGVTLPVDQAKRLATLFAAAKTSRVYGTTGTVTTVRFEGTAATVTVLGSVGHDGVHTAALGELEFPRAIDNILRGSVDPHDRGQRVNAFYLKKMATVFDGINAATGARGAFVDVYPAGPKMLGMYTKAEEGTESVEAVGYIMGVRMAGTGPGDVQSIDGRDIAARMTGER